jgi:hypothetical protein
MSDPRGRGITVTIKYGRGYQDTWAVFHGSVDDVRADLTDFFGLASASETDLTLSDLVVNATAVAHGVGNIASALGGVVIASEAAGPVVTEPSAPDSTERPDPWKQADATAPPQEPEPDPVLTQIQQAPTVRALELLWVENQAAFAEPAVMAAWKARGRELNASA